MSTIIKPVICPELLSELKSETNAEKQVIVHCGFRNNFAFGNLIRIWKTTYLLAADSSHKSKLLFTDNISLSPVWTEVPLVEEFWFTLIFSGLPSDCEYFDLAEVIPEPGGFFISQIKRNKTDIYRIKI